MRQAMPYAQQLEIAASLEDYHKVFFTFFEMSGIYYSESIPTAAVQFIKDQKPSLMINQDFWEGLTHRERLFVIIHECLHVILDHGVRNGLSVPGATPRLVNVAQDIVINEMAVDLFGYDREDLRDWKKFCWIDTCFEHPHEVKRNETFFYYLDLLIKKNPKDASDGGPEVFDQHELGSETSSESQSIKDVRESTAQTLADDLTAKEIEEIIKALPESSTQLEAAGRMTGMLEQLLATKQVRSKVKFQRLIRKLKKTSLKEKDVTVETFTHDDRRFLDLLKRADIMLPGKGDVSRLAADRLLTALFMDVSGSCISYLKTFNQVFNAFDAEREIFDVRLFIFDTVVTEIKPGDNVRIGGGTSFNIIEQKCLELEKEYKRYPDCVVILTDGEGTEVAPKAPSKWIWLLTKGATERYIPRQSRKFYVSQVTF